MPDLPCIVDGRTQDIYSDFSGISDWVALAEDAGANVDDNNIIDGVSWVNTSNVAVQYLTVHMEFDTSGITSEPTGATLKLYGSSTEGGGTDVYIMKSFFATAGEVVVADHQSWMRQSSGGSVDHGFAVKYSDKIDSGTTWSTSGYNEITLNSTALSDMVSRDDFQLSVVFWGLVDENGGTADGATDAIYWKMQDNGDADDRPILSYSVPRPNANLNILSGNTTMKGGKIIIK